jgi:Thaumatin family/Abnormal spindle-like microcephaly-assoc'd, ASPM-SPD-2-Hydin
VSLFELTSNSATNVNYDVSLVSGYNTAISVVPSSNSCYAPGCVTDLNQVCPANLQVSASPAASPGPTPIPCGGGFCQTGFCQNNSTCVIGCNQPGLQCTLPSPPAGLQCTTTIPPPTASPSWTPEGSEYVDMYAAKNVSNAVTSQGTGISMASANQGTATCWADIDCMPGQTCTMGLVPAFPDGVGICLPDASPPINCGGQSDVGNPCGGYQGAGYPDALGYTCVSIIPSPFPSGSPTPSPSVACVPAVEAGLGSLEPPGPTPAASPVQLFSGLGGLTNPEWQAAAMQAGNGNVPYYETFSNACPHEYAWQYDDNSGGLNCDTGNGGANVNMTISFGQGSPTPTVTPTPIPTPSPAGPMTVLPKVIGFGVHKVGSSTKPRIVTVVNPLRNKQSMAISGISTTTTEFTIDSGKTTTCTTSTTLKRGGRCKVGIIFSPEATGMQTDMLTIQSNANNQPRTVTLRGRGR